MVGSRVVISMENMTRVLNVDPERLLVTVEGGVSLHQLCVYLKGFGLQPPSSSNSATFKSAR
jgi:FAD/FMN-containing dehydrogenase